MDSSKKVNPNIQYEVNWLKKFNQLCYEVFYLDPKGAELLKHMEIKFFRSPVAFPNMEPSWAYFNEGKNELIRSFTNAIQSHMNEKQKTAEPKKIKRKI